jgi:hypothetical protein
LDAGPDRDPDLCWAKVRPVKPPKNRTEFYLSSRAMEPEVVNSDRIFAYVKFGISQLPQMDRL